MRDDRLLFDVLCRNDLDLHTVDVLLKHPEHHIQHPSNRPLLS